MSCSRVDGALVTIGTRATGFGAAEADGPFGPVGLFAPEPLLLVDAVIPLPTTGGARRNMFAAGPGPEGTGGPPRTIGLRDDGDRDLNGIKTLGVPAFPLLQSGFALLKRFSIG